LKIKTNLHIYKSKKVILFYISTKYERQLQKFLHKHVVIECIECKPPVKFVAKIRIIESKGYFNYSILVPRRYIPEIIKTHTRHNYTLLIHDL